MSTSRFTKRYPLAYRILIGAAIGALVLLLITAIIAIGIFTGGFGIPALAGVALFGATALSTFAAATGGVAAAVIISLAATAIGGLIGSLVSAIKSAIAPSPEEKTVRIQNIQDEIKQMTDDYESRLREHIAKETKRLFSGYEELSDDEIIGNVLKQNKRGFAIGNLSSKSSHSIDTPNEKAISKLLQALRVLIQIKAKTSDNDKAVIIQSRFVPGNRDSFQNAELLAAFSFFSDYPQRALALIEEEKKLAAKEPGHQV